MLHIASMLFAKERNKSELPSVFPAEDGQRHGARNDKQVMAALVLRPLGHSTSSKF